MIASLSRSNNKKDMTAVIEQWRETLALAHQNAEAGIDIEAVLSMALLPSVSPQNGSHSDDMAGSNDNDLSVAAFEDKPKRNKVKYQCRGCGAAVWGKAGLNIECGDCELAFIEN
uniref:Zinc metalloproteinase Mpr protein n=1 Tax=Escherichia coli TaxID=562 RepID=A0A2K9UZU5_ECOLX|nr:zinc metalloproteinase Mpr protein [Escherichia coli]